MKKKLAAAGLIAALVSIAYSNSLHCDFHLDDYHQLVDNAAVRTLSNIPRFFVNPHLESYYGGVTGYRPLTLASFALNYYFGGYGPAGYHLVNILLHISNAFLVFLIVSAVADAGRERRYLAILVAGLFAVHPVQTSAVTYISGRAVLLASFFSLLAFYSFLRFRDDAGRRGLWLPAAALTFLLGLLSKEIAVSVIGLAAAYDFFFRGKRRPGFWLPYVLWVLELGGFLMVKSVLQGSALPEGAYGVAGYFFSEMEVILGYIRLLLLPVNQNAYYALPLTGVTGATVASSTVVMVVIFVLVKIGRRDPALGFFGLWFFVALAPESTLVPITDLMVEYRPYMASAGLIAAVVLLAGRAARTQAFRPAAVLVMVLLTILTYARNGAWATEKTLWTDVVNKSPGSVNAWISLGSAYVTEKDYSRAAVIFRRGLMMTAAPADIYKLHNNLGLCYDAVGRPEDAIREYKDAIGAESDIVDAYINLGCAYFREGRYADAEAAFEGAEKVSPGYPLALFDLSLAYKKLGQDARAPNSRPAGPHGRREALRDK